MLLLLYLCFGESISVYSFTLFDPIAVMHIHLLFIEDWECAGLDGKMENGYYPEELCKGDCGE